MEPQSIKHIRLFRDGRIVRNDASLSGIQILMCSLALTLPQNQSGTRSLTIEEGRQLVESVPEIRRARDQYRRPEVSDERMTSTTITFQARNMMTKGAASGLIGNYQVDRRTGRVWRGIGDTKDEVCSYRGENLRQQFLSASQGAHFELDIRSENLLEN